MLLSGGQSCIVVGIYVVSHGRGSSTPAVGTDGCNADQPSASNNLQLTSKIWH
jgi:hypothetical protein